MPADSKGPPSPFRVLIAEDEIAIAMDLEANLRDAGFDVVGPAATATDLASLASTERLDGAIVDFGLLGPDPQAALAPLVAGNVAMLIMTGYDQSDGRLAAVDAERMTKPAHMPDVVERLHRLIVQRRSKSGAWDLGEETAF